MIDLTKKYKTRDGRPVTDLREVGSTNYPISGILEGCGRTYWKADGMFYGGHVCDYDLVLEENQ